jgi:hypothetical protein
MAGPALAAQTAVVAAGAADYSSGAHSIISVNPMGGPRAFQNNLLPTAVSDIITASFGEHFYRIERYKSDSVTKFHIAAPQTPISQFSTLDSPEQTSNNPHDMIFVSETKAYMPMFGNNAVWIVNPSATTQAEFKVGELDISAYADSDGIPEAHQGIVVDGRLFLLIQRWDRDTSWTPSNIGYVAVFDVATDTEIDTGQDVAGGLPGIPMPIKAPNNILFLPETNTIYVSGAGRYPYGEPTGWEYTGGICVLDPATYYVGQVLDDGDADNHPFGGIGALAVLSPEVAFFTGYQASSSCSVFPWNPSTYEVGPVIPALQEKNLHVGGKGSLTFDENNLLWVPSLTEPGVVIYNPETQAVDEIVPTNLNPGTVALVNH